MDTKPTKVGIFIDGPSLYGGLNRHISAQNRPANSLMFEFSACKCVLVDELARRLGQPLELVRAVYFNFLPNDLSDPKIALQEHLYTHIKKLGFTTHIQRYNRDDSMGILPIKDEVTEFLDQNQNAIALVVAPRRSVMALCSTLRFKHRIAVAVYPEAFEFWKQVGTLSPVGLIALHSVNGLVVEKKGPTLRIQAAG